METFRRVVVVAALAGLISGAFVSVLHWGATAPLIAKAETYEEAAAHDHEAGGWTPKTGFEQTAFTVLADILTGIGFGLLLVAAYALRGADMNWRKGMFWGLAGFATFTLAPSLGLPPALPGAEAAPLLDRQLWWLATAAATGSGLALIFLARRPQWIVAGVALLVLPHIVGAPQPAAHESLSTEPLARQFIAAATVTSFLFWLALGALTGFFYKRFHPAP